MMMIRVVVSMVREYKPIAKAGCTASSALVPTSRNHVPERRFNRARVSSARPNKSSSSVSKR
jgi:hypothetical protein